MSNPKFRSIAPKPQEFFAQNPDVIAVATLTPSILPENREVTTETPTNSLTFVQTAKISKKQQEKKTGLAEDEGGWNDENTGKLISYLEENFISYKKKQIQFC